jgi:hypothetical protein
MRASDNAFRSCSITTNVAQPLYFHQHPSSLYFFFNHSAHQHNMARTKTRAHTCPDVPGNVKRAGFGGTPFARIASSPSENPACATDPSVVPITTDWIFQPINRAAITKHTRDLRKAHTIITAYLNGQRVNKHDIAWAKELAMKEQELYEAENATISADSEGYSTGINRAGKPRIFYFCIVSNVKKAITDEQGLPKVRHDNLKPPSSGSSLTAANLAALDSDSDSILDLNSVSDVSDLKPNSHRSPKAPPRLTTHIQSQHTTDSSKKALITAILPALRYEQHPSDLPRWLTGLPKPFYHPSLNADQNYEFKQLFYFDEIERLEQLRPGKDWVFEHFGSTREVSKVSGGVTQDVFMRGVWKKMIHGEVRGQRLDEWPLDLEGEPLGWGMRKNVERYRVESRDVGSAEKAGNEDDWEDVEMNEAGDVEMEENEDDWEDVDDS